MAGSIGNMAAVYKKKNFTYVPPTPPAELIESTSYSLDFAARKFVHIGIDPSEKFQVVIHFLTPARYVKITPDFLNRIYSLMGNLLSFVLNQPENYKRTLFLETEFYKLSSMVCSRENVLVIESKTQDGCRLLLNRADLIQLQYLEWCIFETVSRKSTITQPAVIKQFEIMGNYLDREFTKVDSPPKTSEEMIVFIKNLSNDKIIVSNPKEDMNFISQLKMYASSQLAEHWAQRWSREPELFTESEMRLVSPPRYSSMSPMHEDLSQATVADDECGIDAFLMQINPTQATWAPARKTKPLPTSPTLFDCLNNTADGFDSFNCGQYPPWHDKYIEPLPTSPAVDENDGPTSFNHSPSILCGKPAKKRNAKRKLFLNDII